MKYTLNKIQSLPCMNDQSSEMKAYADDLNGVHIQLNTTQTGFKIAAMHRVTLIRRWNMDQMFIRFG